MKNEKIDKIIGLNLSFWIFSMSLAGIISVWSGDPRPMASVFCAGTCFVVIVGVLAIYIWNE